MRWVGSDHLRSIGVRVDPSRVVGVRGCAGMCVCVCVCVHEGGGSRAASAESRIENRNRSRCRCLGLLVLPFFASAGWGRHLSPARVPVCEPADRRGSARLPASFKFGFCSSFPFQVLDPFPCLLDFGLGRRDVLLCGYQTGSTANRGMSVPTVTTEFAHHHDHCRLS